MKNNYRLVILSKALPDKIETLFFINRLVHHNKIPRKELDYCIHNGKYRVIRKIYDDEIRQDNYLHGYHWRRSIINQDKKVRNWLRNQRRRK